MRTIATCSTRGCKAHGVVLVGARFVLTRCQYCGYGLLSLPRRKEQTEDTIRLIMYTSDTLRLVHGISFAYTTSFFKCNDNLTRIFTIFKSEERGTSLFMLRIKDENDLVQQICVPNVVYLSYELRRITEHYGLPPLRFTLEELERKLDGISFSV